jgi:hypothetical protein
MAISEKSRSAIYQSFSELLCEEATADMLAQFPSRDVEEPATRADLAVLRAEMGELRAEMRGEMGELRAEMRGEMGELRAEMRGEMGELRIDMHRLHNRTLLALAAMISAATAVLAVLG